MSKKEKPIIFNTEMVKAILDGQKTQTRRPIKPQPEYKEFGSIYSNRAEYRWSFKDHDFSNINSILKFSPLGKKGDLLWVRETWWQAGKTAKDYFGCYVWMWQGTKRIHYHADGLPPKETNSNWTKPNHTTFFPSKCGGYFRKRPSIHMPRWASRITLEITDVRVEQVQDITEEDAKNEGVIDANISFVNIGDDQHISGDNKNRTKKSNPYVFPFAVLWDSIYSNKDLGWKDNPWVWVYEFKVKEIKE